MSSTTSAPAHLNGVDTDGVFATIGAVRNQPELGRFQFRATNRWLTGTHNRGVSNGFHGAGQEHTREKDFVIEADHPAVLVGEDRGPTPAELLLHALAACLMSGLGNIAAARGIRLDEATATIEGDIDLRGIFGIGGEGVRNGFDDIRLVFHVKGDAEPEELAALVEQSRRRSAVFDVLTNGVPVSVSIASA